jgi:cation transport regulator ChaC
MPFRLRWLLKRQWLLARLFYRAHGLRLEGARNDPVWYFGFGSNMHDSAFRERRGMRPSEWRAGRIEGYRLRFNLRGRGRGAPANIAAAAGEEVWGVLYRITWAQLVRLDRSEGVPGRGYRHLWLEAEDSAGNIVPAVTYMARGQTDDGTPSLRYLTLLREGGRAHGLPEPYLRYLDGLESAD